MPAWFDSHCHLYDIEAGAPEEIVERARAAGVADMVVLGVDVATSKRAIELASIEGVHAGAAFHPTSTEGWTDPWADEIDALLADDRTVAVGESGIDLYWDKSYFEDQRRALIAHVALAKKHDKALVLHTRDSIDETLAIVEAAGAPDRLVFHCWSGGLEQLRRALALGSFVSFAGNVSFKNAGDLREAARRVPSDRLLIETDAPYLTPVPHRGKRNEPAYVVHTGEAVAAARGETLEETASITTANAKTLFGLG